MDAEIIFECLLELVMRYVLKKLEKLCFKKNIVKFFDGSFRDLLRYEQGCSKFCLNMLQFGIPN